MKNQIKYIVSQYIHRKNSIRDYNLVSLTSKLHQCKLEEGVSVSSRVEMSQVNVSYLSSIGRYSKVAYTDIGKYCAISWDTTINAVSHPYDHLSNSAFPYVPHVGNFVKERKQNYQRVTIKNDVWVGANSVIMPGVTIGNGAIVGAGAVVTKDVPDYAIVVGVPAKVVKYRFSHDMIARLLKLQWWELDPDKIKLHIDLWADKLDEESLESLEKICK